jgi:hypothetical protein
VIAVTLADLLRAARALEAMGHPAEAVRLEWLAASRAVTGRVAPAHRVSSPAPSGVARSVAAPSCPLVPSLDDLALAGELPVVAGVLGLCRAC